MREWLIGIRKDRGLTQKEVAEMAFISQSYYSMLENGHRGCCIPLETAQKIADLLGFSVEKFSEKHSREIVA